MPVRRLIFVLGDQLNRNVSSLQEIDLEYDFVLMAEVQGECSYVRHHKQKIVLILSAMRHFARTLVRSGIRVDYIKLNDPENTGSVEGELKRALIRHQVDRIVVTEPGEWRLWEMMQSWEQTLGTQVEIREDNRFFCSRAEFANWARGRKALRMELFYRHMRRKTGWLMVGERPEGGRWNYDADNRKRLPRYLKIPPRRRFTPDTLTRSVIELVEKECANHFGDSESFAWAVTRKDALKALRHFIMECLPYFGAYQDAMTSRGEFLYHSVLSPYINIGLLRPTEVCKAALNAYHKRAAPVSAVEGFVRQILGWREYVRGIYWTHMPAYRETNFLNARRPLPDFYWTAETTMQCLRETVEGTRRNAYAHHIQRLMITGNFALLAGISPAQVQEWYLIVYADAFEWVELPNTHGMALFADGGLLGSKPYAASGAYIDRMSDYCARCAYDPKIKLGPKACPFNYLYWYFLIVNENRLKKNPRMAIAYRVLDKMAKPQRQQIIQAAKNFLARLND